MLAQDYEESKLRFPVGAQPKIDGVRGHNPDGTLLARSNKVHANKYTTTFFSRPEYQYFDGELAAADERDPKLCTITSSALRRIDGSPFVLWHAFDLLTPEALTQPYWKRHEMLHDHVEQLQVNGLAGHMRVVPLYNCNTMDDLLSLDSVWLELGYEGTIIRDLQGKHKQGRSTVREMGLLRIKRFVEEEAIVIGIIEGRKNLNAAQVNELGKQFRSGDAAGMVPNGEVGTLVCELLKDSDLFKAGDVINVSPGVMTQEECVHYFNNQQELLGQVIKFKHFPKGVKDKPRFPVFQSIRSKEDL